MSTVSMGTVLFGNVPVSPVPERAESGRQKREITNRILWEKITMLRLRPYNAKDADSILSWSNDEIAFYKWSAGVMGKYPITKEQFGFVNNLMAFTAVEDDETVGFFTMRRLLESFDELRFGFVVVAPSKRGKGYGKGMLQLGLKYAFEIYGAKRVSLGVFENNESAYFCYKEVGFEDVMPEKTKTYCILGEEWKCREMMINNRKTQIG